jgi:hypothetical protein
VTLGATHISAQNSALPLKLMSSLCATSTKLWKPPCSASAHPLLAAMPAAAVDRISACGRLADDTRADAKQQGCRFRLLAELRPALAGENSAIKYPAQANIAQSETGTGRAPVGTTKSFPTALDDTHGAEIAFWHINAFRAHHHRPCTSGVLFIFFIDAWRARGRR